MFSLFAAALVTSIAAPPPRPGWFLCDGVDAPFVALAGAVTQGRSIITMIDRRSGARTTATYAVGPADPGAGQIYRALSRAGRPVGAVHGVNPGMVPGAGDTPPITGLALEGRTLECRWLPGLRLLGLSARRSIAITAEKGDLVYQSFNGPASGPVLRPDGIARTTRPSLRVAGGTSPGPGRFRFENQGYVYEVTAQPGAPAAIRVLRGGRLLAMEPLLGVSVASAGPSSAAPTPTATIGAADAWQAQGLEACRQGSGAVTDCLARAMARGGATPAARAFAARLGATGAAGYVSAWRQAGPVGIATITYPFRANATRAAALVPATGAPLLVDDRAPDGPIWARFHRAHPDAFPIAPAMISAAKTAGAVALRARQTLATCRACAPLAQLTTLYRFDAAGRFTGATVEAITPG
ncbi:hypothetical protein [Sphingomonas morindae]|uniref:Uncharacterized protein n=1 Tax=Sphingomonas morindae TaxID=1541170 RepID=A0ABY4XCC0_9SPHN|nr:hypothetical protein [Sphingomonas morindae]USI74391.1 hypothetical protein LHA26_08060 [Sphingomonas morindae]